MLVVELAIKMKIPSFNAANNYRWSASMHQIKPEALLSQNKSQSLIGKNDL